MDENRAEKPEPGSYFAPTGRASDEQLQAHLQVVSHNPVLDSLLQSVSGLLAVLNQQRQILAVNEAFLAALGLNESNLVLGLRPGEAVQCVHAHDEAGGCGTSKFCRSCGAAIAIVTSLGTDRPAER
jgi:PAS domain-containing protein